MIARRSKYATRQALRGFTIVEALVALVVLAVGMLGIASLYVTTLRASGSATSRMQAINLAGDLGDRIRANRTAQAAYAGAAAANGTTCIGTAVTCTAAQMAAHDLFVWQAAIAGGAARCAGRYGGGGYGQPTRPRTRSRCRGSNPADWTQSFTMNLQI